MKATIFSKDAELDCEQVEILSFIKNGAMALVRLIDTLRCAFYFPVEDMRIDCPECGGEVFEELVPEITGCANMLGQAEIILHRFLTCKDQQLILAIDGEMEKTKGI